MMDAGASDATGKPRIELTPVIKEIVRTEVCFPNIKLLVDRIFVDLLPHVKDQSKNEAFRLLLADGEKSIQALVKRRSYKSIIHGDICEGSYILVKKFHLDRARRLKQEGHVMYIVLDDFYAIGDDGRPSSAYESFATEMTKRLKELHARKIQLLGPTNNSERQIDDRNDDQRPQFRESEGISSHLMQPEPLALSKIAEVSENLPGPIPASSSQKKRKRDIALGEIDPNFGTGPSQDSKRSKACQSSSPSKTSIQTKTPRPPSANGQDLRPSSGTNPLPGRSAYQFVSTRPGLRTNPMVVKRPQSAGRAAVPDVKQKKSHQLPFERPLNIKPLVAFRGYPRRNDIFDVFVVIQSVADAVIKRPRMPPKRDIRIVDPSTDKKVLLSVFVDPENFVPVVGTIALIRSVTTHEWEGGMLNIYPNQCEGKAWFMPNPESIAGCDVEAMRLWWARKQTEVIEQQDQG